MKDGKLKLKKKRSLEDGIARRQRESEALMSVPLKRTKPVEQKKDAKGRPHPNTSDGLRWERKIFRSIAEDAAEGRMPMNMAPETPRRVAINKILKIVAHSERKKVQPELLWATLALASYNDPLAVAILRTVADEYEDFITTLEQEERSSAKEKKL